MTYTVFDQGQTRSGTAEQLLAAIHKEAASHNDEIARMSVEQYAQTLIEDAPYFLDEALLKAMQNQRFDSKFDQALNYLAQMPTSGIRILTMQAA